MPVPLIQRLTASSKLLLLHCRPSVTWLLSAKQLRLSSPRKALLGNTCRGFSTCVGWLQDLRHQNRCFPSLPFSCWPLGQQQVRCRSNRSRRGLYDGKDVRTGNNVSFSMKATKRKFRPNVFVKRVYSSTLDAMIPFHLTASALRSIDKAGGLDMYLLNNKDIVEGEGYAVRKKILQRLKNRTRMARKEVERAEAAAGGAAAGIDGTNEELS